MHCSMGYFESSVYVEKKDSMYWFVKNFERFQDIQIILRNQYLEILKGFKIFQIQCAGLSRALLKVALAFTFGSKGSLQNIDVRQASLDVAFT